MKRGAAFKKNTIENEFVDKITSLFPKEIVKVILFGSRAKGISKPGSDYDFVVVLKEKNPKIIEMIYDIVTDFLIEYGADVSLKIYKEKTFQEMASIPTPFMESIRKTGRELWSQNPRSSL